MRYCKKDVLNQGFILALACAIQALFHFWLFALGCLGWAGFKADSAGRALVDCRLSWVHQLLASQFLLLTQNHNKQAVFKHQMINEIYPVICPAMVIRMVLRDPGTLIWCPNRIIHQIRHLILIINSNPIIHKIQVKCHCDKKELVTVTKYFERFQCNILNRNRM